MAGKSGHMIGTPDEYIECSCKNKACLMHIILIQ